MANKYQFRDVSGEKGKWYVYVNGKMIGMYEKGPPDVIEVGGVRLTRTQCEGIFKKGEEGAKDFDE